MLLDFHNLHLLEDIPAWSQRASKDTMWLGRAGFEMVNNRADLNSPPWASLAATLSKNDQFYPFKSSAIDKVPNGVFPVLTVPMCIGVATTYSIEYS